MTRHTWRPGGATYYPMDGARQRDPLEPDDVIAALDAMAQEIENLRAELDGRAPVTNNPNDPKLSIHRGPKLPCGGMTINYVGSGAGHTVEPNTVYDSSAEHWSPWLPWKGGPCPLPPGVDMDYRFLDGSESPGMSHRAHWGATTSVHWAIGSFRYRADNPAGWLARGDWIPPAELWDVGCPVRCEWRIIGGNPMGQDWMPTVWNDITHIRLVARQPQAGLPEGWKRTRHGDLVSPSGRTIFVRENVDQYGGGAVIRQAVDAWLREMGDG